ncbi:MAG: ring-1,2-phenylacetyl-CoA epoxidase subunit PaaE [Flavobacteriales bacterium]|jgi:ring-1,2-phenylacetyl-CoA epoxidase subunit PaaE
MSRFFTLKIAKRTQETSDSVSLNFEIPRKLEKHYKFKQGQYLTLKEDINGEEIRRSYSICTSPFEGQKRFFKKKHSPYLTIGVKAVEGGRMSDYLCKEVKEGDSLQVMTPNGRFFTELNKSNQKHYVLIAAGSGITPVISHIKSILYAEPNSTVVLNYGNRSDGNVMFHKELDELVKNYADRFFLYHYFSRNETTEKSDTVLYHRVKPSLVYKIGQKHLPSTDIATEYFICGPALLIDETVDYLKAREVAKEQIHFEYFSTASGELAVKPTQKGKQRKKGNSVVLTLSGMEYEVNLKPGQNILSAVLKAKIDAPFSCESGVCCTCMALAVEGEFDTSDCISLSDEEKESGHILTCVTKVLSDKAVISYDDI